MTFEPDARGLIGACPNCGRRNRLLYERLDRPFRCSECHQVLPPPARPVDVRSTADFDALVGKSVLPVLVDFWAPWCGPCKMVAPEVAKVAGSGAGRWLVVKVDTEEVPDLAGRSGIRAIPTMALFLKGREVARQAGAMPAPAMMQFIQQAL